MINVNTLNKLEKLGIGCDIDGLENYVALINYSEIMGNCIVTDAEKEEYIDMLKQLKPNSDIFKYNWDMEKSDIDKYDEVFLKCGAYHCETINNISINNIQSFLNCMNERDDIFAYALPDGIDIRLVYVKGVFYGAYTFNINDKGKDITEYIFKLVPYNIQEISDSGILDIRARITITDDNLEDLGLTEKDKLTFISKCITEEFFEENLNKCCIIVYKIFSDIDLECETLWDEYELLEETEFNVAEHALIRDIAKSDLVDAIKQLENHFINYPDKEYMFTDICICINQQFEIVANASIDNIITISEKHKAPEIYESAITGVKWIHNRYSIIPRLEIIPIITKGNKGISYIDIDNINTLEKYRLVEGTKVNFYLDYTDNVILCDNNGNKIE